MRQIGECTTSLTLLLPKPNAQLTRVCEALCLQSKNVTNTGLFLIRQALSAYTYDAVNKVNCLKTDLHPHQIEAIQAFNNTVTSINDKRRAKHPVQIAKALEKGKPAPQLKLIPLLETSMANLLTTVLDATVLDNVVRAHKNDQGKVVYKRLPGAMAQQALLTLKDIFSSYFKSLSQFKSDAGNMTGRPCLPRYKDKNSRCVIEIPLAAVHGALPSLKGKDIPEDYLERQCLQPEVMAAFSDFNIEAMIAAACKQRGFTQFEAQHLRIVPLRKGVKMEVVVRVHQPYPHESFLAKITAQHGDEIALLSKQKELDAWLLDHLKDMPMKEMPRIYGMDLGLNNLNAGAYSTGIKAEVHING